MRSHRQLSASITLLSFNETNLPIKRLVLCGISRSLFLFLEYKNVKIVGGLISRKIDQTTICAQSLEHSSERNDTSFAGYCTNSRKDRSYLDLSRSRKLASSLLLTRSGLVGNLGAKKGVSGTGCHPRVDLQYRKLRHDKTIKRDTVYDQWIIFPFDCVSILVLFKIWKEIDEFSNISIISSISSKPTL